MTEINSMKSLRDEFAMVAMQQVLNNPNRWLFAANAKELAEFAYRVADAMMEARKS